MSVSGIEPADPRQKDSGRRAVHTQLDLTDMLPTLQELLQSGRRVRIQPAGRSMTPTLRDRKDTVLLQAISRRPRKHDIVLYQRGNGTLVLHRIVGEIREGYMMCGDAQFQLEYPVAAQQLIGVVAGFWRGEHWIDCMKPTALYRLYCCLWGSRLLLDKLIAFGVRMIKRALAVCYGR